MSFSSISTISTVFGIASTTDRVLVLDPQKGITVSCDITLRATCDQVFKRLATLLAASLASSQNEPLEACFLLRERIRCYEGACNDLPMAVVHQVRALVNLLIIKASTEDTTGGVSPLLCRPQIQFPAMSPVQYPPYIIMAVKNLGDNLEADSENAKVLPSRAMGALRQKVLTFLSGKMGSESNQLFGIEMAFFDVMSQWWEVKAKRLSQTPDKNSSHAHKLLAEEVKKPTNHDFETLIYPRDLLYIEKCILHHLIALSTTELLIAGRLRQWLNKGVEVSYENVSATAQSIILTPKETGILELGLFLQTKRACCRVVKHGVDGYTEILLKKLQEYKAQKEASQEFFDLCVAMLTINELVHSKEKLRHNWDRLFCAGSVLLGKDDDQRYFSAASYLPRKRVKFLYTSGVYLHTSLHETSDTFNIGAIEARETIVILYVKIFKTFISRFLKEEDSAFYEVIAKKIAECRNNSKSKAVALYNFEQIAFKNRNTDTEYVWHRTEFADYKILLDDLEAVLKGVVLKVPALLRRVTQHQPGRGFIDDIKLPEPHKRRVVKQKRALSSSRSPSPESAQPLVEKLTEAVANITIQPKVQAPVKATKTKVALLYASRVRDWFSKPESKNDPFVKESKYSEGAYSDVDKYWIRARHNFALAVDGYLDEGIETTDANVLKEYKAKRRIQLVGEISVTSALVTQTKKGIFTYSIGKTGHVFHRWFTPKNSKEIINPGAEKGWEVLEEAQEVELSLDKEEQLANDKSYVEHETQNLVTIVDEKNNARIRIVRLMPIEK